MPALVFLSLLRFPGSKRRHLARVSSLVERKSLVLDTGCGNGELIRFLSQTKDCLCVGVDVVDDVLRGTRLPVVRADGAHLPFRDWAFDVVMSHQFMSHVGDPARSLKEQIRVLRPWGRLVMSDENLLSPLTLFDLVFLYPIRTRGRRGGLKWLKGLSKGIVDREYLYGTPQKDEDIRAPFFWNDLFKAMGLTDISFPFKITYLSNTYIVAKKPLEHGSSGLRSIMQ